MRRCQIYTSAVLVRRKNASSNAASTLAPDAHSDAFGRAATVKLCLITDNYRHSDTAAEHLFIYLPFINGQLLSRGLCVTRKDEK